METGRIMDLQIRVENRMTPRLKNLLIAYRQITLIEFARWLDAIRENAASKQIIASFVYRTAKDKDIIERRPWTLYRLQKSTPGRLTERTGALIKMLRDKNRWWYTNRVGTQASGALKGRVRVMSFGTGVHETYEGTLNAVISNPKKYSRHATAQQLFMRFRWETGIRGGKRQFLEPAAESEKRNMESILMGKITSLEYLYNSGSFK